MPTPMPLGQAVSNSTAATGSPTAAWAASGPESTAANAIITLRAAHRNADRRNLLSMTLPPSIHFQLAGSWRGLGSHYLINEAPISTIFRCSAVRHDPGLRARGWPTIGRPDPSGGAHASLSRVPGGRSCGLRARRRARGRPRPGTAPSPAAREARHGRLSHLVRAGRPGAVRARGRAPALVLVRRGGEGLRRGRGGRLLVRDGPVGDGDEPVPPDLGAPHAGGGEARAGGGGEGARRGRADRARARLRGRGRDVLPRRGHPRPPRPGGGLREGDGARLRALPGRPRGGHLLSPRAAGDGASRRQDLREPEEGGGDPEPGPARAAGASRRRALPDPQLRLPGAGRAGASRGAQLFEDRQVLTPRAAHALAHLRAAGPVGRLHPRQRRLRSRGSRARGEAAALEVAPTSFPWAKFPYAEAITYFARGVGAARSGDVARAREAVARLEALRQAAIDARIAYWPDQIDIQRRAAAGWLARAEGRNDDAQRVLREAVELEAATDKHPVTPGAVLPARELRGDLLLELGRPAEALSEYEASLKVAPKRRYALAGAARART